MSIIEYTKSTSLAEQFPEFQLDIYGSVDEPLFPGMQICEMLKIVKIHYDDFEEGDDYVTMKILNGGQMREQNMFTEEGFYNIIFKSRTPLGKKFRKFVTALIKDLRMSGQLILEKSFQEFKNEVSKEKLQLCLPGDHLYIMKCANDYKIGRSICVSSRLGNLQTGNACKIEIVKIWPGRGHHERHAHEHATGWFTRIHGEWFAPHNLQSISDLITWIDTL